MKTTKTNVLHRALGLVVALMLIMGYSCSSDDKGNDEDYFTYIGTVDHWCEYLILIEKDNNDLESSYEFVKPINLDSSFKVHELKVKVTYSYMGEQQMGCGGFVGNPEKVKIIKIKKL